MTWQKQYLDRFYGTRVGWIDGTTEFHTLCSAVIPKGGTVLEIGPGPSNKTSRFLAKLGELHGVDVDEEARQNDALVSAHVVSDDRYPFPDGMFDACVSNYVAEHVENPAAHLKEIARVLKPGGTYLLRTPNALHYVALVSRLTPFWFHRLVANRLRDRVGEHDPYPTFYAMNSVSSLRKLAASAGLRVSEARLVEKEPSYGLSSRALFLGFMAYERVVNSGEWAAPFRSNIFAVLTKPST